MDVRFSNGSDRSPITVRVPGDSPVPRVGETVLLPQQNSSERARWVVKSVLWDYASPEASVDICVTAAIPARTPSFAAYTD